MPIAFLAVAWLLVMTGIRGDYKDVGAAFSQDVIGANGQGGFIQFGAGLIGIAVFFRLIGAPNAGKVFLGLVILVFMIQNPNILTALQSIGSTSTASAGTQASAASSSNGVTGGPVTLSNATTSPAVAVTGATTTGEANGSGSST